jgi:hypothetical protein
MIASERDQIAWWLACGATIREIARRLGRSPCEVLNYQIPLEVFTAIRKVFGLTLEFMTVVVSKRVVFETQRKSASLGQTEALQIKATWRADQEGYSVRKDAVSLH